MEKMSRSKKSNPAAPGNSKNSAASVGTAVKTKIERGDRYSAPEVYNLEITVCEVLRGDKAHELIRVEGCPDIIPDEGFDLILARIRFGYFSKGRGFGHGNKPYEIGEGYFVVVSQDGKTEYRKPSFKEQPLPSLIHVPFLPGDVKEGWVPLMVPKAEQWPFLIFKREYAKNTYGFWGPVWFEMAPSRRS